MLTKTTLNILNFLPTVLAFDSHENQKGPHIGKLLVYLCSFQSTSAHKRSAKDFLVSKNAIQGVLLIVQELLEGLEAMSFAGVPQNFLYKPYHLVVVVLVLKQRRDWFTSKSVLLQKFWSTEKSTSLWACTFSLFFLSVGVCFLFVVARIVFLLAFYLFFLIFLLLGMLFIHI